jgi:hypothetical protein
MGVSALRSLLSPALGSIAITSAVALSGCAGSGAEPAARLPTLPNAAQTVRAHPTWWREAPATVKEAVYVSNFTGPGTNVILGFGPQNRKNKLPECTVPGQMDVFGIASDASGNVYVPTFAGATNIVNVYAPGCGKLIARVNDPYGNPSGAAVRDSTSVRGSTFYVEDLDGSVPVCTLSGCSSELTDPSIASGSASSVAVDSFGNVWASYYNQSFAIALIVWPGAKMPGHIVSGYVNTAKPGGIDFDKRDNLIAVDSVMVRTYTCKARGATCTSTGSFPLQGTSLFGALNRSNTDFQVTDQEHGSVDVYAYPGFSYQYSYNRGSNGGLAPMGITQTR